jgi:integrase
MKIELEDSTAAKLVVPAGKRDVIIWDSRQEGLFVRKFESGRCVYGVRYFVGGKEGRKTLREHVAGTKGQVAKARDMAADVRAKARLGEDVLAEERTVRAERKAQGETIAKLVPAFLKAHKDTWRPSYYRATELYLTDHLKKLAEKPVKAVTRDEVADALKTIATKRGKVSAARVRASLSTFYAWACDPEQRHADVSPIAKGRKKRGANGANGAGARSRTLKPAELREIWLALDHEDVAEDYRRVLRLLILTGQRRDEVGKLPWREVNLAERRLELRGTRTKNHRDHLVPLSALALAQLPAEPDRTDPTARTMVFGRRAHTGFSGWGKAKAELDSVVAEARRKRGIKDDLPHWTVHDLRRTAVTLMAEHKIAQPHVIEAIVNHISGHKAGVAGTYNRATYLEERMQALDAWSEFVERLATPAVAA